VSGGAMKNEQDDYDVLVVGAGIAGLAAARALAEGAHRVLVLEAQGRVGGRILTRRVDGEEVELGAEFVHGRPPMLLALIEEAGLELIERTGSFVRCHEGSFSAEDDEDGPENSDDRADGEDQFSLLEGLEDWSGPDLSFAEFLDERGINGEPRANAVGYVEGFNAADHRVASVAALGRQQKAEDAIEGDRMFHVSGGYDQLPGFLAARLEEHGGDLRLNAQVREIRWQTGRVVATTDGGVFSARRAVIALPLGVLQQGSIRFEPALPDAVQEPLRADGPIRMGNAVRFTLIFRERFWSTLPPQPAMSELSFLLTAEHVPSVWWTTYPERSNALTGWIGGPRSAELAGMSEEELAEHACQVLAKIFQFDAAHIRGMLIECHTHDWKLDPYSCGAYSYIAKDGIDAPSRFAEPVANTLYFAGEHCTTDGHWGTVHAALGTGLRAARLLAAEMEAGGIAGAGPVPQVSGSEHNGR
jgi:monoamine oxidase